MGVECMGMSIDVALQLQLDATAPAMDSNGFDTISAALRLFATLIRQQEVD